MGTRGKGSKTVGFKLRSLPFYGMGDKDRLEVYKAIVEDAFRGEPLETRQKKAATILTTAHGALSWEDFKKLEEFVFEKLEK